MTPKRHVPFASGVEAVVMSLTVETKVLLAQNNIISLLMMLLLKCKGMHRVISNFYIQGSASMNTPEVV